MFFRSIPYIKNVKYNKDISVISFVAPIMRTKME